jgi:phosphomannomutase
MASSGTRIASISGLRGVVGDGLDPATAVEFAAAYASGCDHGPIAIGHDGRRSAAVFAAAVEAGVTATGHDALLLGATATPTIGRLVRESGLAGGVQISASHNPPQYNGLKFFQRRGMVLGAEQGRALLERWRQKDLGWARWDALGTASLLADPDVGHLACLLEIVDSEAIRQPVSWTPWGPTRS